MACVATSVVMGLTGVICEVGFRALLFSQGAFMERFRDPSLYADPVTSNDWWKLYHAFKKPTNATTQHPHPLLGWTNKNFTEETYLHVEAGQVRGRKPVLFYGDSFTQCVIPEDECFQGILNADNEFSQTHYLLNYGVGGYGVDQIYLLAKHSLPLYEGPEVVVGIYLTDLDRSILSFFVGPKPHFAIMDDTLVLYGTPVSQDPRRYTSDYPPEIWSYLYRLWLYQEGRPWRLRRYLRGTEGAKEKTQRINEKLLIEMLRQIKRQHLPVTFVIFVDIERMKEIDWREQFLAEVFTRHGVSYLSSRDIIKNDMQRHGKPPQAYFIPNDGHPNAYQTLIVAQELKRRLLAK